MSPPPCDQSVNRGRTQRGFTLLEILIALIVLSIGLLGIAALQGIGLRTSHGAQLTSQASLLAYDMADRLRANPQGLTDYVGFSTEDTACDANPGGNLAANDLWEWACSVQALLPGGRGAITRDAVPDTSAFRYTIEIEWEDMQVADGGDPWSFVLVIEL
jgi:type IV pilus assembly protein PilV